MRSSNQKHQGSWPASLSFNLLKNECVKLAFNQQVMCGTLCIGASVGLGHIYM